MSGTNPSKRRSQRLPAWLTVPVPSATGSLQTVARELRLRGLHSVCSGARCPNRHECWSSGTATFMILGAECSRNCRFCAVPGVATPDPVNPDEPRALALAVAQLGLRYVVITSVTRDDLPDGGASHFADTVLALHNANPEVMIELLIPDFQGKEEAFQTVLTSSPDVVGHNLETIARLTPLVRDARASYNRSLDVLSWFSQHGAITKTSFLCGLGESEEELMESCQQARYAGVAHLALGQYLAPSPHHAPVVRYWTPQEFETFKTHALAMGFQSVASGPLVRSSYRAHDFVGSTLRG